MKYIAEYSISGYRSFGSPKVLRPAVPDGTTRGSGLTMLVGPNGGGKSSLLEGMAMTARQSDVQLTDDIRNANYHLCAMHIKWDSDVATALESRPDDPDKLVASRQPKGLDIGYVPCRREIPLAVKRIGGAPLSVQVSPHERRPDSDLMQVLVPQWQTRPSGVTQFLAEKARATIDIRTDGNQVRVRTLGQPHHPHGLGSGLQSLVSLSAYLHLYKGLRTILIDEPELSLPPYVQRRIQSDLLDLARTHQVVIATHSPYFLSWEALRAGAALYRIALEGQHSQLYRLGAECASEAKRLLSDLHNPHLLGTNATEVFLQEDGVILVEGQEDVVCFERLAAQFNEALCGCFFGWGVGGASKMGLVAGILRDLGIRRVVGVLDSDKEGKAVKADLEGKFPEYRFILQPMENIRERTVRVRRDDDKEELQDGLCGRDCRIKQGNEGKGESLMKTIAEALGSLK